MDATVGHILHVDMDAFYAAIEQRDRPELRGQPVIVGAPPDRRGVVSTASYEARVFGVRSAMPSRTAGKLCPQGIFVPPRMERYEEVSGQLMALFRRFTPLVEPVSVDEAFLDVGGVGRFWPDPVALARELRQCIRTELQLTGSVGVAPCKFLAKLASDMQKPDGLTVVPSDPARIEAFLAPLPVRRIWGVGPVLEAALQRQGLCTIGDLQACSQARLAAVVGSHAAHHVLELAHGRDDRPVTTEYEEKSLSAETTFDEDCRDPDTVRQALLELTERVGRRLREADRLAATGQIKVRFADFRTITRQRRFSPATCRDRDLLACALELYAAEKVAEPVRLVGFGVADLREPRDGEDLWQPLLFPEPGSGQPQAGAALDQAVDALRRRYGTGILKRGLWTKPDG